MTLAELRCHPAYLLLSTEERSSVDTRMLASATELDTEALAVLAGGVDALEVEDLRAWLALTATRPWAPLRPCARPVLAAALSKALLESAPALATDTTFGEAERQARALARALVAADDEREVSGALRTETLAALTAQTDRLETVEAAFTWEAVLVALGQAGLTTLRDALSDHHESTTGLTGFFGRAARRFETGAQDVLHAARFLLAGSPDHEGHFRDGVWRNWTRECVVRPRTFHRPRTEAELAALVGAVEHLRIVGGGHGFNDSPQTDDTLISLDEMNHVVSVDAATRTARVQAGIRLRDLNRALWSQGFGLALLGSTDTQSLGGLVASGLHGTGRDRGFLSEQVRSVRIMAADGSVRTVVPGDELFHAVFGALGVCGVVTEVEVQLVPAFHLEKTTAMVDRAETEAGIETLLAANAHLSFYYVGGASPCDSVRMNTWNHTERPLTPDWPTRKLRAELEDFAISAFVPGVAKLLAELDENAALSDAIAPDHTLVMPSSDGFGRKLFYLHDEIEYAVPFEVWRTCLDRVMHLLAVRDAFSIVEVRFTPDTDRGLLSPGAGRRSVFIELATPLAQPREALYAEFEQVVRAFGGQPHPGKKTSIDAAELARLHGARFDRFQAVRIAQDPAGKFLNAFTRRLYVGT